MKRKYKILLTGGYGAVGAWLLDHLTKMDEYEIHVLTRTSRNKDVLNYKEVIADITNLKSLRLAIGRDYDFCIHLASYDNYDQLEGINLSWDVNFHGTRNLLEVLDNSPDLHFIYFSTVHVYNFDDIISESTLPNPQSMYGLNRLNTEHLIKWWFRSAETNYTILRLSNAYGCPKFVNEKTWTTILNEFCLSVMEKNKIVLKSNGKIYKDFIWLGDICNFVETLISGSVPKVPVLNLCSGVSIQLQELANHIADLILKNFEVQIEIELNEYDENDYAELVIDNSLLNTMVNFELSDKIDHEVIKTIDFIRSNQIVI